MAYGNIIGYEPGPQPGSYVFQRANGPPLPAFGPAAEELRAKLDASQQLAPPPAVAPQASAIQEQIASVQDNPDITPQAVAANTPALSSGGPDDPAASALAKQQVGELLSAPPAPATPAAAPPAAEPHDREAVGLFRNSKGQVVYAEPGADPSVASNLFVKTAPVAGTKAGFAPSTMKVEGANTAATPQDLSALRSNAIDQREAYRLSYDLHAQNFAEQKAALDAQQNALLSSQQEAMQRQQQMQQKTDQLQQQYDQAKNDFANSKIDPNRYQRGAVGIGNALAMGLGAYGAAITKSPNFAANFVQQQTQNDIARQEAEIRIKGQTAQTALGDLNRQLGSQDLARTAYQGIQLQRAKTQLETLANSQGTREAAANYLLGASQLDAALQANDLAFRQKAAGHVSTDFRYHAATAGTPGGRDFVSAADATTARQLAPKGGHAAKVEEKTAVVHDALTAADEAGAAAGLKWDPKKGEYEEGPAGSNALVGSSGFATEARQNAHGIISANAGKFAHALGERPPSVDMVDRYAGEFFTNGPQGVLHYKARLSALRRNLERSAKHAGSLPDTAAERADERGDE